MEDFDKYTYNKIIAGYTEKQLVFEMAIIKKQENILYNKKKILEDEFKKRLEEN